MLLDYFYLGKFSGERPEFSSTSKIIKGTLFQIHNFQNNMTMLS